MEEARTKLVCNLSMKDRFIYPHSDGIWMKTTDTEKIGGKKFYLCRQTEDESHQLLIQGSERVILVWGGGEA